MTLEGVEQGLDVLFCCASSEEALYAAVASTTLKVPMLAFNSNVNVLSDKTRYPYFSRVVPNSDFESDALIEIVLYLAAQSGISKYKQVAILSTTDAYGIGSSKRFIQQAKLNGITILTYQQFLRLAEDISIELTQIQNSEARVIINLMDFVDYLHVMLVAPDYELIGDKYIWICGSFCSTHLDYLLPTGAIDEFALSNMYGMLGVTLTSYVSPVYDKLYEGWGTIEYNVYYYTAFNYPDVYDQQLYDAFYYLATAYHQLILEEELTPAGKFKNITRFNEVLRTTKYFGTTGEVILNASGDRYPSYDILNLQPGSIDFSIIGYYGINVSNYDIDYLHSQSEIDPSILNFVITEGIVFHGNTTEYPDIDVRLPFRYWSCDDKESKVDFTGKSVNLHKPNEKNPSNIDYDYYCDSFIDCENLSDETTGGCSTNYMIVYIIFGVIAGLLVFLAIFFLIFTIISGIIVRLTRFRAASPTFLIIICISCIVGFCSIFAWYGKPQKVACGFQPWLLGLGMVSMINALIAKSFRIWRVFKYPMKRKIISDFELIVLWIILDLPALFILFLWTLISTPTAAMRNIGQDDVDHLVCTTGGFTGPPGGIIFFFILVGYQGLVLVFGAFLSIVTRGVPSLFNESKLIAISIYNLVFLAVIIIPVVIVLDTLNPFIAWIIRTISVLYAFAATLTLQFVPKVLGAVFVDRCSNSSKNRIKELSDLSSSASPNSNSAFKNIPESVE